MDLEGEEYMSIIDAFRLDGKVAVVTGANTGLGQGMSVALAQAGAKVVGVARRSCEDTKKLIEADGGEFAEVIADLSDMSAIEVIVNGALAAFGKVDILVNNAGISIIGLFQDMTRDEWDRIMNVNVGSVYNCCHFAIPDMINAKSGRIINISSVWGNAGASCEAAYSATKGAVNSLTKALAKELAPSGICVNAIACGAIDTDMNSFLSDEDKLSLFEEIPAGRMGRPDEAGKLAVMLADAPSYLTGQIITLDGAWI